MQALMDAGHNGSRTQRMQESKKAGHEGCRTQRLKDMMDAGKVEFSTGEIRTGRMQDRRDKGRGRREARQ